MNLLLMLAGLRGCAAGLAATEGHCKVNPVLYCHHLLYQRGRTAIGPHHAPTQQFRLMGNAPEQAQVTLAYDRSPPYTGSLHLRHGATIATQYRRLPSRTLNEQYLPVGSYEAASPAQTNSLKGVNILTMLLQAYATWVKQPWWPATVLIGMAGFMGGYLLIARRRQRQQFWQLRGRLADDLHDRLGALLVRASFQAESLRYEQPMQLSTANQLVATLREASQSMRDIAWGIDPNANTFGSLLDRMQDYVDQLPAAGRCCIKIIESGMPAGRALDATVRQHIYHVFREALTNALRHANGCKMITICLQQKNYALLLQIENDGAFVMTTRPGMGLRSMSRRAREVGGRLETMPRAEGGFKVLFVVPLL